MVDEAVDLVWEVGGGGGGRLRAEPFLEGLLEPFDFAAGGGVVGAGVLLVNAEPLELFFEAVAAGASALGESCGEHHAVVGER